jgi:hypothetical protein
MMMMMMMMMMLMMLTLPSFYVPLFMESKSSLPCAHETSTKPYRKPDESNPYPPKLFC